MSRRGPAVLRALVIAGGVAVAVASVLTMEGSAWPTYVVFTVVATLLFLPHVEVLPGLTMPIPGLAVTIGFLYIGGLPIVFLQSIAAFVVSHLLYRAAPARWRTSLRPAWSAENTRVESPLSAAFTADWGAFMLGLAARLGVATWVSPDGRPAAHPGAMVLGEVAGYVVWSLLAALPIYSFRSPYRSMAERAAVGPIVQDLSLIVWAALTPFVFLIAYGYESHGLAGAVVWSFSTLGLHFVLKSLHERRRTVEEQNRRLEALNRESEHRERLSAIGKMSSVVSHQMLQQLGVIGLYADLIRNADADDDPAAASVRARANAAAIEGALRDVNRVLTDLLVFSRDLRVNLYELPLAGVLAEAVDECRAQAGERGVTLVLECPDQLEVALDKIKMRQAVANVVRNALDVSPRGGRVRVRGVVQDGWTEITIADDGPGIPERDREAVFAPFFSTKEQGTGLGLAIAREFVAAHGGTIAVAAGNGRGATFVLRLPRSPRGGGTT